MPKKKAKRVLGIKRLYLILTTLAILLVSVVIGFLIYYRYPSPGFYPKQITKKASFPLYYPSSLPEGFTLEPDAFSITSQVLLFSIRYENDKKLAITLQPKPVQLDLEDFHRKNFANPKQYFAEDQRIIIGQLQSVLSASIETPQTWVLIKAPSGIDESQLRTIASSFKPLK